jgi:hypothetical protein
MGMQKVLLHFMFMAGLLLLWEQAVPAAEIVGQKLSQTEVFRQYVDKTKTLEEKVAGVDGKIKNIQESLSRNENIAWLELAMLLIPYKNTIYCSTLIGLAMMALYFFYLVKWHPMKWKLMTSKNTLCLLRDKILHRNGLIGLLFLTVLFLPDLSFAKTNVLQDIKMYYAGNEFEKGYLLCKYAHGTIDLHYTEVNGVPVLERPAPGFERAYDVVAHLRGLDKNISAEEFVSLYEMAASDKDRQLVFSLLARTDKDLAQEAAQKIVDAICAQRGVRLDASIGRFKSLLSAFADSNNRLLANGLVKEFLEKGVGRVKELEDLDNLVDLAVANGAFEIIKDSTTKVLKTIPSRLSFTDSVFAARIYFKIDKDMARNYFNAIRFDFRGFLNSPPLEAKIVELMRELSGVAAFLPLYENDALYKSLQQQSNDVRVAITGLFDKIDHSLAAVAYNSIGNDYKELAYRNAQTLVTFAALTDKYKQDKSIEFLNSLKRTVVEIDVPYTKSTLLEVVTTVHQRPSTFIENVLTHDMNTDCRFNRNNSLILSLIEDLTPEQIVAFESYFSKKTALSEGILKILFTKDKNAFYKLLAHVFAEDPKSLTNVRFSNDILDFQAVAPAFSRKALEAVVTLPASIFVAQHELSGQNPDVKLIRRALIPQLDSLFKHFLSEEQKALSEIEALNALTILSLVNKPNLTQFADENFVLDKLVTDYFSGTIKNGQSDLSDMIVAKEKALLDVQSGLTLIGSAKSLLNYLIFYSVVMLAYLLVTTVLSFLYACNSIVPGKNFSLLNGVLHFGEASAAFTMATVIFFPIGFCDVLVIQLIRGLIARDTVTPDLQTCVAVLDKGYRPTAVPETGYTSQNASEGDRE